MKKVYLVIYKSKDGNNINKIKEQLALLGTVTELANTRKVFFAFVTPTDERVNAVAIRNKMNEIINPFEEGSAAIAVNRLDMADTDSCVCMPFEKSKITDSEKSGEKNFHRFKTRHEAFVAWDIEKPLWVYPDNIGNAIRMDIDEWLWMPIKKNGQYERGKYEKYLR